jgi:hypothetical protein
MEDISKQDLTSKDIVTLFFKREPSAQDEKDEAEWIQHLQNEAWRSTKRLAPGELDPPVRIQQRETSPWHWVAITHKGQPGRSGKESRQKGNRYGVIKSIPSSLED